MTCPHGDPFPGSTSDSHETALQTILQLIEKYNEAGRTDVGYKAARKFAGKSPDLVDTFMIAYLAGAGVRALLSDQENRTFPFQTAQVISAFEKRLYGSKSAASVEHENLMRFYQCRIPCSCLDELVAQESIEEEVSEDFGTCAAEGCCAYRPLSELMACAACKSVFYCNANCQRDHWPIHAKQCCIWAERHRDEGDETSVTDLETSEQFSIYSMTSGRSAKSKTSSRSERSKTSSRSDRSGTTRRSEKSMTSGRSALSGGSTRSGKSLKSTGSGSTSQSQHQHQHRRHHDPTKSPTPKSPRKLLTPSSPNRSIKSPSSRRKMLVKQDSKKRRKVRKSISSTHERVDEKKHSKMKKKSMKLGSSTDHLPRERKERRKSHKSLSSTCHEEHKERKVKTRNSATGAAPHHHKESSGSEKKKHRTKKKHEEGKVHETTGVH